MTKGNREPEKKRLVEALIGFPLTDSIKVTGTDCVLISRRDAEDLADKLIDANGVIVPPCKVGDRAWFVDYSGKKIFECEIESITFDAFNDSLVIKCLNRPYLRLTIEIARMQIDVFFTLEAAEKALKEAQNG